MPQLPNSLSENHAMLHICQNEYTGVMEIAEEGRMVGSEEIHRLIDEGKAELVPSTELSKRKARSAMSQWLDLRPGQVFIDPPIFRLQLPEQFEGRVPWDLIRSILTSLGGMVLGDLYFNKRTFTFTFPKQITAKSLRKARALRQRTMRILKLDEQPYLSISTFTIDRHREFVENIIQNQNHPDYYAIIGSYIRYSHEEGFITLNKYRMKQLNKIKRLVKAGKLAPSWLDGLGS